MALQLEIKKNLDLATAAAQNTYDIATHEDSKAENKYDTRGLEASYLAGAQAERVRDLREVLAIVTGYCNRPKPASEKAEFGSLVQLQVGEKIIWVILLPKGGGQSVVVDQQSVQVVTNESPLGKQLFSKNVGFDFLLNSKNYEIAEIF